MSKQLYTLEFPVRCSPTILYDFLSTPAGLSEWFADKVDERDGIFYFGWDGNVEQAEVIEKADKLVKLTVDAGDARPRTIVAGIRLHYPPETLVGTQIVIIANLEPRTLRGILSEGMLLATSDESGLALIRPDKTIKAGSGVK